MRRRHRRLGLTLAGLLALVAVVLPAQALAASPSRLVRFHGYRLVVPAGWPVYRLGADSPVCVRFDRHAVYLGQPSAAQRCSAAAPAGRTEAILVQQLRAGTQASAERTLPMPAGARLVGNRPTAARVLDSTHRVVVTATWNRDAAVIRRALGVRSLTDAARHSAVARPSAVAAAAALTRADVRRRTRALAHTTRAGRVASAHAAAAGQSFTGYGFDACHTPSVSQMAAWGASSYRAIGVYIGGANMACSQPNLNSTWVSQQSAAGWHLIPIYVGLQAPSNSCGCAAMSSVPATAAAEGAAAAKDAVADAQAVGLGAGNPVYLDMEYYSRTATNTSAVLAFTQGWTQQLHAAGYRSGVYGNDDSGIVDLVDSYGTGYVEPDDIWFARWNGVQTTADAYVPSAEWAAHQRMHQYRGAHNESYGGATINIDGDYVDAATAAAGTGPGTYTAPTPAPAPTLGVTPTPNGSTDLRPSWLYATGVTSWQLLGGQSPTALAPLGPPLSVSTHLPIFSPTAYRYYAVTALGAAGQALATSAPVTTPAHLAIFGQSAFIPRRGMGGVPVGCFNPTACSGVTMRILLGKRTLLTTGREKIAGGAGLAYFSLTPGQRIQLWRARHHQELVTVSVRGGPGMSATRPLKLTAFSTADPSPRRSLTQSAAIRFIGTSDFVSNGWVGGILVRCAAGSTCLATTRVVAFGRVIAQTRVQPLGVGETGYLMFKLTPAGHRLLTHARGNQLPATVTVKVGTAVATGHLVLSAYT